MAKSKAKSQPKAKGRKYDLCLTTDVRSDGVTSGLENALYEAGFSDSTLVIKNNMLHIDVTRSAPSLQALLDGARAQLAEAAGKSGRGPINITSVDSCPGKK